MPTPPPAPPGPATDPTLRGIAAALLMVAVGMSVFILQQTLAGGAIAGCGSGSGCETILGSRWSHWLGIPVAGLSLLVYVGLLAVTVLVDAGTSPAARGRAAGVATALGVAAVGPAAWVTILQVGVVGALCKYCLLVHGAGVAGAIVTVRQATAGRGLAVGPLAAGAGLLGVLVAGQVAVSPASYTTVPSPAGGTAASGTGTVVGPGPMPLDTSSLPVLGQRDARFVMLSLFDYACDHCRAMHGYLQEIRHRYGGRLAILALPMPLDTQCNPYARTTTPPFDESCARSRLALAVWRAEPSQFERFDDWMFASAQPRTAAEARAFAEQIVGAAALATALRDPWVDQTLGQSVGVQNQSRGANDETDVVPKLFLGGKMMAGLPGSADQLAAELRQILGE